MAMPLGWQNYFGFVCSERHATQRNAQRTGAFTVSYPRPEQLVASSLAASPRSEDESKPALAALETVPSRNVDGVLVEGAYLWLECELDRVIEGYGENSLITGRIVSASVADDAARRDDVDDAELLASAPLLAYVAPRRFAEIGQTRSFPFPADFRR
jgi:flavin reductase (DIM6/NTAB) family NADH-FMN oxidoreductase RutF